MNFYDILFAKKLSGSGGGGGSGDFTTANVTIVYNAPSDQILFAPFVIEGLVENETQMPPMILPRYEFSQGETNRKVALYKGTCGFVTDGSYVTSVSGNAELMGQYAVLIKGDCTITLGTE